MKFFILALISAAICCAQVDIYSPKDLQAKTQALAQKQKPFAAEQLKKYGNHYTMLAYREETGSSELHEKEADIFVVEEGDATIVTGGKLVNSRTESCGRAARQFDRGRREAPADQRLHHSHSGGHAASGADREGETV